MSEVETKKCNNKQEVKKEVKETIKKLTDEQFKR